MAKSGMNPKTLQYLMGHSDISVTMNVYTHIGSDDAEEELKRIEGAPISLIAIVFLRVVRSCYVYTCFRTELADSK